MTDTDQPLGPLYRRWVRELAQMQRQPDVALVASLEAEARDVHGVELVAVARELRNGLVAVAKSGRFAELLHPRGKDGQWIEKFSLVDIFNLHGFQHGQRGDEHVQGKVTDILPNEHDPSNPIIRVEVTDPRWDAKQFGPTVDVDRKQITQRAAPKGKLPGGEPKAKVTPEAPAPEVPAGPKAAMPAVAPSIVKPKTATDLTPMAKPPEWDSLDSVTKTGWVNARMSADLTAFRGKDTKFDTTGMDGDIAFGLGNTYRNLAITDPDTALRIDAVEPGKLKGSAIAVANPGTAHPGGIGPIIGPISIVLHPAYFSSMDKWESNAKADAHRVSKGKLSWSVSTAHGDPGSTLEHEFGHQRQFRMLEVAMRDANFNWNGVSQPDGFGEVPDSSNWEETQKLRYDIQHLAPTEYGQSKSSEAYAEAYAAKMKGEQTPELTATVDRWEALMMLPSHVPNDRFGKDVLTPFADLPSQEQDAYWEEHGSQFDHPDIRARYPQSADAFDTWAASRTELPTPTGPPEVPSMKQRYEIRDSQNPGRGKRFTDLEQAQAELAKSVPPGRFYIQDRQTKKPLSEPGGWGTGYDPYGNLPEGEAPAAMRPWTDLTLAERGDLLDKKVTVTYKSDPLSKTEKTQTGVYLGEKGGALTFRGDDGNRFVANLVRVSDIHLAEGEGAPEAAPTAVIPHGKPVVVQDLLVGDHVKFGGKDVAITKREFGVDGYGKPTTNSILLTFDDGDTLPFYQGDQLERLSSPFSELQDREAGNVYIGDHIMLPGDIEGTVTGINPLEGEWMELETDFGTRVYRSGDTLKVAPAATPIVPPELAAEQQGLEKTAIDKATVESYGGKVRAFSPNQGGDGKWAVWTTHDDGSRNGHREDFDTEAEAQAYVSRTNLLTGLSDGSNEIFKGGLPDAALSSRFGELQAKYEGKMVTPSLEDVSPDERMELAEFRGFYNSGTVQRLGLDQPKAANEPGPVPGGTARLFTADDEIDPLSTYPSTMVRGKDLKEDMVLLDEMGTPVGRIDHKIGKSNTKGQTPFMIEDLEHGGWVTSPMSTNKMFSVAAEDVGPAEMQPLPGEWPTAGPESFATSNVGQALIQQAGQPEVTDAAGKPINEGGYVYWETNGEFARGQVTAIDENGVHVTSADGTETVLNPEDLRAAMAPPPPRPGETPEAHQARLTGRPEEEPQRNWAGDEFFNTGERVRTGPEVIDPEPQEGEVTDYDGEGFTVRFDDPEIGEQHFDWTSQSSGDITRTEETGPAAMMEPPEGFTDADLLSYVTPPIVPKRKAPTKAAPESGNPETGIPEGFTDADLMSYVAPYEYEPTGEPLFEAGDQVRLTNGKQGRVLGISDDGDGYRVSIPGEGVIDVIEDDIQARTAPRETPGPAEMKAMPATRAAEGTALDIPGWNSGVRVSTPYYDDDGNDENPWTGTITVDHANTSSNDGPNGRRQYYETAEDYRGNRRNVPATAWRVEMIDGKFPTGVGSVNPKGTFPGGTGPNVGRRQADAVWQNRQAVSDLMQGWYDSRTPGTAYYTNPSARLSLRRKKGGGWYVYGYDNGIPIGVIEPDGSTRLDPNLPKNPGELPDLEVPVV